MIDRDKVIDGLKCHVKGDCAECPYREGWHACNPTLESGLFVDALALLKEQEERIKKFELERSWDEHPDTMGKW